MSQRDLWRASWRHLRSDRELLMLPPLHVLAFLVTYLLPVAVVLALIIASDTHSPVALVAILGSVAAGYWMALGTGEFFKIVVAESCRQRWHGTDPTLRSALGGAWKHRAYAFHPRNGSRSPFSFDVAGVVYGRAPMPSMPLARSTPTLLVTNVLGMVVLFGLLALAQVPVRIAQRLGVPSPSLPILFMVAAFLAVAVFLYTQGLGAIVASIEAAAEHHLAATATAPPGFEALTRAEPTPETVPGLIG